MNPWVEQHLFLLARGHLFLTYANVTHVNAIYAYFTYENITHVKHISMFAKTIIFTSVNEHIQWF